MAFLSQNGLFLAPLAGVANTLSFNATEKDPERALVAFHPVMNGKVQTKPVVNICHEKKYALQVLIPSPENEILPVEPISKILPVKSTSKLIPLRPSKKNSGCPQQKQPPRITQTVGQSSQKMGFLITDPTNTEMFLLSSTPPEKGLVLFQPTLDTPNIFLDLPFVASLIQGSKITSSSFLIQSSESKEATKLGYTSPFPNLLSNCQVCGCGSGQTCTSAGTCTIQLETVCPENAWCGALSGKCFGPCPLIGSICKNVNGEFTCVPEETQLPFFKIIIAIVASIAIAIALYFLILALHRAAKPGVVYVTEAGGLPVRPFGEHVTVAVGSEVY